MTTKALLITGVRRKGWLDETDDSGVVKLRNFSRLVSQAEPSVELFVTSMDRIQFSVDGSNVSLYDEVTGRDLAEYDVIQLRNTDQSIMNYADYAKAVSLYAQHRGVAILDPQDAGAPYGKLSQAVLFALNGIATPKTWARWRGDELATQALKGGAQFPLIAKASMGTMGVDNFLIESPEQLVEILGATKDPFVVQEQVPNEGDYRVLILGEAEPFIFWRPRIAGSHLSNTSRGSVPEKDVTLPQEALDLALRAQAVSERVCVGVDIMQNSESGEWIVLEVNNNPALATGAFNDDKAVRYAAMIKRMTEKSEY